MSALNKRAMLVKPREALVIEEKPVHDTPPNGLVIKTHFAGICHSDVHIWENEMSLGGGIKIPMVPEDQFPRLMGHEISGEVYSLGSEVTCGDLKVGDKVILYAWAGCKACGMCSGGRGNICVRGSEFNVGCSPIEGGYQEYVSVAQASDVIKVPDNVPMDMAALLPCSGLTTYSAVRRVQPVLEEFIKFEGKATMLVIGAGGLGQWAIQIAKALFPEGLTVVSADISEEKVALGKKAGADETVVWPISASIPEVVQASKAICPGGFHAVLDFVNNPDTIGRTFQILTRGAITVQVGLFGGNAHTVPLGFLPLLNVSIVGIFTGSYQQQKDLVDFVSTHKMEPPPIFKVKLEEAYDYLMRLKEGKVPGRAVIDFVNS